MHTRHCPRSTAHGYRVDLTRQRDCRALYE